MSAETRTGIPWCRSLLLPLLVVLFRFVGWEMVGQDLVGSLAEGGRTRGDMAGISSFIVSYSGSLARFVHSSGSLRWVCRQLLSCFLPVCRFHSPKPQSRESLPPSSPLGTSCLRAFSSPGDKHYVVCNRTRQRTKACTLGN